MVSEKGSAQALLDQPDQNQGEFSDAERAEYIRSAKDRYASFKAREKLLESGKSPKTVRREFLAYTQGSHQDAESAELEVEGFVKQYKGFITNPDEAEKARQIEAVKQGSEWYSRELENNDIDVDDFWNGQKERARKSLYGNNENKGGNSSMSDEDTPRGASESTRHSNNDQLSSPPDTDWKQLAPGEVAKDVFAGGNDEVQIYLGGVEGANQDSNNLRHLTLVNLANIPRNEDGSITYKGRQYDPRLKALLVQQIPGSTGVNVKGVWPGRDLTIGRSSTELNSRGEAKSVNRFAFPDTVSGQHVSIVANENGVISVEDLHSTNGTSIEYGNAENSDRPDGSAGNEPENSPSSESYPDDEDREPAVPPASPPPLTPGTGENQGGDDDGDGEADNSHERDNEALDKAAARKHAAYADRLRRRIYLSRKEKIDGEYAEAQDEYAKALEESMLEQIDDGELTDEMRQKILALANDTAKENTGKQLDAGGWWADKMNKFSKMKTWKKVAFGMGAGAAFAATGGLLGAAGVGAATALLTTSRFAKTHAMIRSKLYADKEVELTLEDFQGANTREAAVRQIIAKMRGEEDRQIEEGDKIKKRAFRWALGSVAAGSAIGYAGANFVDRPGWLGGGTKERTVGGVPQWIQDHIRETQGRISSLDSQISAASAGNTAPTINPAALHIERGEGWYQTFSELGITDATTQRALLNNEALMSRLESMGVAYRDPSLGGWGMNMTPDGKMPQPVVELFQQYSGAGSNVNTDQLTALQSSRANELKDLATLNAQANSFPPQTIITEQTGGWRNEWEGAAARIVAGTAMGAAIGGLAGAVVERRKDIAGSIKERVEARKEKVTTEFLHNLHTKDLPGFERVAPKKGEMFADYARRLNVRVNNLQRDKLMKKRYLDDDGKLLINNNRRDQMSDMFRIIGLTKADLQKKMGQ